MGWSRREEGSCGAPPRHHSQGVEETTQGEEAADGDAGRGGEAAGGDLGGGGRRGSGRRRTAGNRGSCLASPCRNTLPRTPIATAGSRRCHRARGTAAADPRSRRAAAPEGGGGGRWG